MLILTIFRMLPVIQFCTYRHDAICGNDSFVLLCRIQSNSSESVYLKSWALQIVSCDLGLKVIFVEVKILSC